jgi:hypothetical protein
MKRLATRLRQGWPTSLEPLRENHISTARPASSQLTSSQVVPVSSATTPQNAVKALATNLRKAGLIQTTRAARLSIQAQKGASNHRYACRAGRAWVI